MKSADVNEAAALLEELDSWSETLKALERPDDFGLEVYFKDEPTPWSLLKRQKDRVAPVLRDVVRDAIQVARQRLIALGVEFEPAPRVVNEPSPLERGAFVGDTYFGDPADSTLATHSWNGSAWVGIRS